MVVLWLVDQVTLLIHRIPLLSRFRADSALFDFSPSSGKTPQNRRFSVFFRFPTKNLTFCLKFFLNSPISYLKGYTVAIINLKKRGYSMGFIKYFDLPEKKAGESLNTADRAYLIKLIVVMGLVTASLRLCRTANFA